MLELVAGTGIDAIEGLSVVAIVIAIDILGAYLKLMTTAQRAKPVNLQGVLGKTLALVHERTCIGERHIVELCMGVLLIGMLACKGKHIRQGESLALEVGFVLIVESAIPRVMIVAWHPVAVTIAVELLTSGIEQLVVAIALNIERIEVATKRG